MNSLIFKIVVFRVLE